MGQRVIKQERAHETRLRILEGAAAAFADHGFAGATIAEILKRSGATKGALYFHFETKEQVADAVLAKSGELMSRLARDVEGDGVQRLINLSYLVCDGLAESVMFRAAARLAVERETYGPDRPTSFRMWETMTRRQLQSLNESHTFITTVEVERLSRMLTAGLLGLHLAAQAQGDDGSQLHGEVEFFWRGFLPLLVPSDVYESLELSPRQPVHA